MNNPYWLIERPRPSYENPEKIWLAAYVASEDYSRGFFWTDKSHVAVHFARKEDAEKMLLVLNLMAELIGKDTRFEPFEDISRYTASITEHLDCEGERG